MANSADSDQLASEEANWSRSTLFSKAGYIYLGSAGQRLTLKAPRKTASENVVCLCRLLNILANFSKLFFAYWQTVWTQIRLLLKEQSDLGPHCLQKWLLKSQAEDKAALIVVIGPLRVKMLKRDIKYQIIIIMIKLLRLILLLNPEPHPHLCYVKRNDRYRNNPKYWDTLSI